MKQVTEEQFFQAIGPRDIITSPEGSSRGEHGIWSLFKTRSHIEVGRIYTKPEKQHLLTDAFFNQCGLTNHLGDA